MQTARHFFSLPSGASSIGLTMEISFEKECLHGLKFVPAYPKKDLFCEDYFDDISKNFDKTEYAKNLNSNTVVSRKEEMDKTLLLYKESTQHDTDIAPFARAVFLELAEYFMGVRTQFTIPLEAKGTDFQRSVWKELLYIPYGETCSYKDIAMGIGNPKACRAVGLANNRNPIALLIPCHRVIGANGALMGYAGQVPVKAALLALEKQVLQNMSIKNVNHL